MTFERMSCARWLAVAGLLAVSAAVRTAPDATHVATADASDDDDPPPPLPPDADDAPAESDGPFVLRQIDYGACERFRSRASVEYMGSWSPRYGPMCASTSRALDTLAIVYDAAEAGCGWALADENRRVATWLGSSAGIERAFCDEPADGRYVYAGRVTADGIRDLLRDHAAAKLEACFQSTQETPPTSDLAVTVGVELRDGEASTSGTGRIAHCIGSVIEGVHFPQVDASVVVPLHFHASDPRRFVVELSALKNPRSHDVRWLFSAFHDCYERAYRLADHPAIDADLDVIDGVVANRADPILAKCVDDAIARRYRAAWRPSLHLHFGKADDPP